MSRSKSVVASLCVGMQVLCGAAALAGLAASPALAQTADAPDTLILHGGRTVNGKVLEETDTRVRFLLVSGGIKAERWFDKSEILKINKAEAAAAEPPKPGGEPVAAQKPKDPVIKDTSGATRVYVVELKGKFGIDISQTPIREAVKDSKRHKPEYLIFVLENDFSQEGDFDQLPDDVGASGELFRAEQMCPIFAQEIPEQWALDGGEGEPPQVIFWVKQAMGGAAVLPLSAPSIYFSPEGRLGGLGDLSLRLGSTGDEVVRQKMYSAMMSHIESWGIKGGYDYRLMRAICRYEYVLSYQWVGGKAVYLERMPENPGEILLTDDADEQAGRRDTVIERVRATGNDVLTLNADIAKRLGFSKGTAETLDDLIFALGIGRNSVVVPGRSKAIMEGWTRGVADAKRDLRRLVQEFGEIQVQGDYAERSRGRGQQIAKLNEMKKIIKRYGESLDGRFYQEYGVPTEQQIDYQIERIKMEQQADKR